MFIELTKTEDGDSILVNLNKVTHIFPETNTTTIYFESNPGENDYLEVSNNYNEVKRMILNIQAR